MRASEPPAKSGGQDPREVRNEKAPCSVRWCVAQCAPGSTLCPVHRLDPDLHPGVVIGEEVVTDDPELFIGPSCDYCEGDGTVECSECDGDGTHTCEHRNCYDEHNCGNCDGTGEVECEDCEGTGRGPEPSQDDTRYVPLWAPIKGKVRNVRGREETVRWTPQNYVDLTRKAVSH